MRFPRCLLVAGLAALLGGCGPGVAPATPDASSHHDHDGGAATEADSGSSPVEGDAGVPATLSCPDQGAFCGKDGVTGGEAETLYQCAGRGQAPSGSQACSSGCQINPPGTDDACKGATVAPVCPGTGSFCGNDGVTGGDAKTLYSCSGAGVSPTSQQACADGCDIQSTGDACHTSTTTGAVCPGPGLWCGSDGMQGADAATLYKCARQGDPPTSATPCPNGCQVNAAGINDACKASATALSCPGSGPFCGNDGVVNGDPATLYQCSGQGAAPTSSQSCAHGCQVFPAGTPDVCKGAIGCPGAGFFCGKDGVGGGDAETLYHCPGAGAAPDQSTACASGCQVNAPGVNDLCSGTLAQVCPGAGGYCGSDGITNGDGSTLYHCPGKSMAPDQSTACPNGCQINPAGTDDVCKGASGPVCPGAGGYCGSDGITNGDASTLYHCPGKGSAPDVTTPCPNGCQVNPPGTNDVCKASATLTCTGPAAGYYCGNDLVTGGSANVLYHCPGTGQAPDGSQACPNGCQINSQGVDDACKSSATPLCPGAGAYCGSDGVTNGTADTLYQCPSKGSAPSSSQACANGCQVNPAGVPDACKSSAVVCPGAGGFCGNDGVTNGDANTLYQCPGKNSAPSSSQACANGCQVNPAGTNDACKAGAATCPGAGDFCGNDGVTNGDASTLYVCPGAGQAPSGSTACSSGCVVMPAGTNDYCGGSCTQRGQKALSWEAGQLASGNSWPSLCLGFVNTAFRTTSWSEPYMSGSGCGYSAATSLACAKTHAGWTAWSGSCPCGGVLYWPATSSNSGFGHIVICNGDGTVSTSGWHNYGGNPRATISWLNGMEGAQPAGYILPTP